MIFSTFNQVNIFLIFLFLGIIFGIVFLLFNILFLHKFLKNIKKIIINCIFYMFFSCIFVFFLNIFNFGDLNIFLILIYIVGFLWSKKVFENSLVFLKNKCYTKNIKEVTNTGESKKG